jgi:GNAT superfamily N-acetyltransferase
MSVFEETRGELLLSTDRARIDRDLVHRFIAGQSYWARGIPRDVMERAIAHSLCFAVYRNDAQLAFARVITDSATYAYLADVFVLPGERGQGLGKWMMEAIGRHPELQNLRRWMLMTADAHGLYAQFGFTPLVRPERAMERLDAEVYVRLGAAG